MPRPRNSSHVEDNQCRWTSSSKSETLGQEVCKATAWQRSKIFKVKRAGTVEERDQEAGGRKGAGKCWRVILAKLSCYTVCRYDSVPTNSTVLYNYNVSIKRGKK